MSSDGTKFAGCSYCYEHGNITYGDDDGRCFERRLTETGYRTGSQTITYDEDGDIEDEGDPQFYDAFEPDENEYDYGDISCTYCGNEVTYNGIVILWEDNEDESISLYEGQDDDEDEDEDSDEDVATPIIVNTGRRIDASVTSIADQISAAALDVDATPDTTEVKIVFTQ